MWPLFVVFALCTIGCWVFIKHTVRETNNLTFDQIVEAYEKPIDAKI